MFQDQLQQKIVCPGVVTCITASPNGLFLAAGVNEAIYLWEVSHFLRHIFVSITFLNCTLWNIKPL